MSAACVVLPFVWGTAAVGEGVGRKPVASVRVVPVAEADTAAVLQPQMAFYRKYTESLLRRYLKMSMEAGRAPSLLGREMFRGKVTNYRVNGFDDVVIFVHDVEKCLAKLDRKQQQILRRLALEEYTIHEASKMLDLGVSTVVRRYGRALDALTEIFLEVKLLEPMKSCQGGPEGIFLVND